ncbi:MAG: PH domain-containing protein [Chthoniobacterales bacterium]|nr:PH domain-containing protein [Chthoniobacterales bacterium]
MIESKSDQRLLKYRHQRLRERFSQRTQASAQSRPEHERLSNQRHRRLVLRARPAKTSLVAEETVWRGSSSQAKNLGIFILAGLFCWLIVPIFIALARYLQTKNKIYELTTERLKITEGVFSKVTDTLELYRVKDLEQQQPFIYRTLGVENIVVKTSDASSPTILLEAIPVAVGLADKLRNNVELIRAQKRVREIDIE